MDCPLRYLLLLHIILLVQFLKKSLSAAHTQTHRNCHPWFTMTRLLYKYCYDPTVCHSYSRQNLKKYDPPVQTCRKQNRKKLEIESDCFTLLVTTRIYIDSPCANCYSNSVHCVATNKKNDDIGTNRLHYVGRECSNAYIFEPNILSSSTCSWYTF